MSISQPAVAPQPYDCRALAFSGDAPSLNDASASSVGQRPLFLMPSVAAACSMRARAVCRSKLFSIAAALTAVSCIGDLNTVPLNSYDRVPETAYGTDEAGYLQGLAKIYFQFISNDTKDLQVSDGGASELNRAFWSLQETTTDEAKCAWANDAWVRALNTNTWSESQNDATYAVYVRTLQGISYVNEFLRETTDEKLDSRGVDDAVRAKVAQFRAEARFLRAYFYWMAIDTFGNVPFITEDSDFGTGVNPEQGKRKDIFDYCITELRDLASETSAMPAARSNYPRADKGAVCGLLARMYLNAEVYSGTAMWQEAKDVCEDIFGMGYDLCPSYPDLFRGDNGENPDALKEIIFASAYDAEQSQSYGGTSYLTLAAVAAEDVVEETVQGEDGETTVTYFPNGVNNGWAGVRVPFEFVSQHFDVSGQGMFRHKPVAKFPESAVVVRSCKDAQDVYAALYDNVHGFQQFQLAFVGGK